MATMLYKRASGGEIRQWKIWVENEGTPTVFVEAGVLNGSQVKTAGQVIEEGKQGRDAYGQAVFVMESKINKKNDEGYFDTIEKAETTRIIRPMLAVDFKKRGHSILFPATAQRKFDGVRCLASLNENGEVDLLSRRGKPFPHLNHLRSAIAGLDSIPDDFVFDGELYSDTLTFQEVVGLVRRESLKVGDDERLMQVSYRLYDCLTADENDGFLTRHATLKKALNGQYQSSLMLVENVEVTDRAEVETLHNQFVAEGYEGIMVRNNDGVYGINKRSKDLQKFKHFLDDEFSIVGFLEGTGNDAGTVIWVCTNDNNDTFKVRPRGTREQRREWFSEGNNFIGSTLTVRYFELTDDGIPRFPVGIAIRDYE